MKKAEIIEMQKRIGTAPDGFWGPKSIAACQAHLKGLMPKPNPWPKPAAIRSVFGQPGEEHIVSIKPPVPMYLYDSTTKVRSIRCHWMVAESLSRALTAAFAVAPDVTARYFGCYNYRPKRGANILSTHSWGIAIDLDASTNQFKSAWPVKATMPLAVMEAFAREGWKAAGAFWGYDAMHFEATSI
jgi:hypothetical protein